ncbi:conserved Plasmodium protein, unknown function [Plasmodium berghei]|uniref:Uncharacterized protein n=2 Tax=Plasmodium berghei TaxID=5821 RepID=A0A509AQ44_PLABA|nr:conserved Plasmodium protein, unknown function [Plasmodium berghei ANKA]CXJ14647.1 conserved Plasmodium protein, unknown function [Plasmodium berghei]SCN28331.1 conserved Plasmodium protein, unknown function [Plasmodium berghei]VUC58220.1 conserved Plasmodium protein, unknown function [Plasmodium berghei ANKA]|eukprot:XP_034423983.1 conserved Plasmodium protein, unknown function [Plasmodium berghei ANKA]
MLFKMNKTETKKELISYILSELEKSKLYINEKISCKKKCEEYVNGGERYHDILDGINKKITDYNNYLKKLDKKNEINGDNDENCFEKNKAKGNFFQEYLKEKNNNKIHTSLDMYKLQKKAIVGYTTKGNAIIINNENFDKSFKNYYNIINDQKKKTFTQRNKSADHNNGNDKRNKSDYPNDTKQTENEEENEQNYLSEQSCSSSSIISLNSFVQKEKIKRINKNREAFAKHKYKDNSFVTHQMYSCSDCSSTSFDWYEDQYDNIFYYTNVLNEYKHFKKDKDFLKIIKGDEILTYEETDCINIYNDNSTKKYTSEKKKNIDEAKEIADYFVKENCIKDKSPFYNYIYFKYQDKDKNIFYPVFINTINGKKKMYNLKKINKYNSKNVQERGTNKYELDISLFSYKNDQHIPSIENETIDKRLHFQNSKNLRKQVFDNGELNYSIEKIVHQLEKLYNPEKDTIKKVNYNDKFANFIKKNRDYISRESITLQKLCGTEKIKLKVKIIGTNGKEIKNKSLDNVLINKNKTFGDLAKNLGHSFKLPKEDIENIKIFFDGDLCDKSLSFDNEELGLEDGFQIDVKFPLANDLNGSLDDSSFSEDSYVLFLPDSYVID